MSWMESPLVIIFAFVITLSILGIIKNYYTRRMQHKERLTAIEKGLPIPREPVSPKSRLSPVASSRKTGIVLIATSLGIMIAFAFIALLVKEKEVLVVSSLGTVLLLIGAGYLLNSYLLKKDEKQAAPQNPPSDNNE
ncbi:MAG: hypothetical protein A2Y62_20075 [Candidatus Fischerbacteria bacterium RBG_13_37_8]|uniref:DUF6249 domain-containing protein n=1 Tax=Candidatus Fischerbacteria bacterium RBG_13_37_8 TaxID=1817863 RepID=A0A1F5VTH2_9BACT|nr:MAG: hypothetical protein A2Y62_20075 [Candidatus Fischerbacteria bacterium RBG_13_37_8]